MAEKVGSIYIDAQLNAVSVQSTINELKGSTADLTKIIKEAIGGFGLLQGAIGGGVVAALNMLVSGFNKALNTFHTLASVGPETQIAQAEQKVAETNVGMSLDESNARAIRAKTKIITENKETITTVGNTVLGIEEAFWNSVGFGMRHPIATTTAATWGTAFGPFGIYMGMGTEYLFNWLWRVMGGNKP